MSESFGDMNDPADGRRFLGGKISGDIAMENELREMNYVRIEKWNFCVFEKSKKLESFKSLGSLGGFVCFLWKRKGKL